MHMKKYLTVLFTVLLLLAVHAVASDTKPVGSAIKAADNKKPVNVSADRPMKQPETQKMPIEEQSSDEPKSGEEINWQVMSSGGGTSTDGSLNLSGTLGQVAVGVSSDGVQDVHHGYWQDFSSTYLCGDANSSGYVDIDDIIFLIDFIFTGGPPPDPYSSGDVNCAESIDVDDIIYLIDYIFTGGRDLCDPDDDGIPDC